MLVKSSLELKNLGIVEFLQCTRHTFHYALRQAKTNAPEAVFYGMGAQKYLTTCHQLS